MSASSVHFPSPKVRTRVRFSAIQSLTSREVFCEMQLLLFRFCDSAFHRLRNNCCRAEGDFTEPPPFPFSREDARRYQESYADWAGLPVEWKNELGMTFVLIPPGTFLMGSPAEESGHKPDETLHAVTLTKPFYLSRYETTVGQFRRFVEAEQYITDGENNGGGHAHDERAEWKHCDGTSWRKPGYAVLVEMCDEHPVVHVSHTDSRNYCRWLAEHAAAGLPRPMIYDLPTEAQWEWACRAGSATRFWWGADDDRSGKVANVGDQALKRTHPQWPRTIMPMDDGHAFPAPVGSYQANGFGLHDMLGNVWEFWRPAPVRIHASQSPIRRMLTLIAASPFAAEAGATFQMTCGARHATRTHRTSVIAISASA